MVVVIIIITILSVAICKRCKACFSEKVPDLQAAETTKTDSDMPQTLSRETEQVIDFVYVTPRSGYVDREGQRQDSSPFSNSCLDDYVNLCMYIVILVN